MFCFLNGFFIFFFFFFFPYPICFVVKRMTILYNTYCSFCIMNFISPLSISLSLSLSATGSGNSMSPGDRKFQFSFILPADIPSSFTSQFGNVMYQVKAEADRPWALDQAHKVFFSVNFMYDLNRDPLSVVSGVPFLFHAYTIQLYIYLFICLFFT